MDIKNNTKEEIEFNKMASQSQREEDGVDERSEDMLLFDQSIMRSPSFMNIMVHEQKKENNVTFTENGALSNKSSLNDLVDLFYKAMRDLDERDLKRMMRLSYQQSPLLTAKMVAYVRDVRGGKGERALGRNMLNELAELNKGLVSKNLIHYIQEFGRWDDGVEIQDPELMDKYIEMIAEQLKEDKAKLEERGEDANISLCAKWVPSEGKSLDKKYKIYKKITMKMGVTREELRKNYIVPLRRQLDLVETKLMKGLISEIDYEKVPTRCMYIHGKPRKEYKEKGSVFRRVDGERFDQYLESVKKGEKKINASILYPHEVMKQYYDGYTMILESTSDIVEEQWKVLREKTKSMGKMGRTLVMSDVSGSMQSGTNGVPPILIAISLGILISECCDHEAFRDYVLTFSEIPEFHKLEGETLYDRIKSLRRAKWGMNTNFEKVFRMILERATKNQIPVDMMPERIIVISDMQFDCATNSTKTNFERMDEMYRASGYKRPQIIYWNVNGKKKDVPVLSNTADTGLVSGYSVNILESILNGESTTPEDMMLVALNNPRYDVIVL